MTVSPPSLDKIFKPENVAVIGATEKIGSVGRTILKNLVANPFGGTVFPVNPKRPNVLGIQAYPSVKDIPVDIDLAVIVTPAPIVPSVIQECVDKGIQGAIIISAGFKEIGPEGVALENQILEIAKGKMRIIGPNCLGVMLPIYGLNATFALGTARPGNVAFISQSGAINTAVLDWSFDAHVGFSAFISIGSMLDVSWGDLITYLGDDPNTHSIVMYMESVGQARSFLSAAREVAFSKPIIVIKAGRTEVGAAAAASHTGSLAGSDEVLDAAFRRSGVLRVDRIAEVFNMAEVLSKQPIPKGNNLTIITNAGGPGVLATDWLIMGGGQLTQLSPDTFSELNEFLPSAWSRHNPVDILGDADPERYARALEIVARDPNSDGMLVILTPQDMTDPTETAKRLEPYANIDGKPVLASWMGGVSTRQGDRILNQLNIPTFEHPDEAVRAFNYMWRYNYNLKGLYETPTMPDEDLIGAPDRAKVDAILKHVREENRSILTEAESKEVLGAYGIPVVPMKIAHSYDEAVAAANEIGYPVVLKLNSETVTHKTDVGGVQLNLKSDQGVRDAFDRIKEGVTKAAGAEHFHGVSVQPMVKLSGYELIIGSSVDPQFGPVLLFGTGGSLVEIYKDRALALPPLTSTLARRMMEQTKIYEALKGVRGRQPIDMEALETLMVRFSQLVVEQPWIREMDINPLLASHDQLIALDGRVVLHPPDTAEADLPELAIRPYPSEYVGTWVNEDDKEFLFRPIRAEDEPLMVEFHENLSERTVKLRFFDSMSFKDRTHHDRLSRLCFVDYDREIAIIALYKNPKSDDAEIAAIGRLTAFGDMNRAEFGLVVADRYQGQGVGSEMITRLIEMGKKEGVSEIVGHVHPLNESMLYLAEQKGFSIDVQEEMVTVRRVL